MFINQSGRIGIGESCLAEPRLQSDRGLAKAMPATITLELELEPSFSSLVVLNFFIALLFSQLSETEVELLNILVIFQLSR